MLNLRHPIKVQVCVDSKSWAICKIGFMYSFTYYIFSLYLAHYSRLLLLTQDRKYAHLLRHPLELDRLLLFGLDRFG